MGNIDHHQVLHQQNDQQTTTTHHTDHHSSQFDTQSQRSCGSTRKRKFSFCQT